IFMAIGLYGIFHSTPIVFQQIGAVTTTINRAPDWVYPLTLILGLGGGMILGRTGVDLQAVVDEKARRGISIVEAVAIATTILTTTLLIGVVGLSEVQIQAIIDLLPMMLVASLPIAFALSWIID